MFSKLVDKLQHEHKLDEESETNNIEYKLRLDKKEKFILKKMGTQMKWRIELGYEILGCYEAIYILGINNNGTIGNLTEDELNTTNNIFISIVKENNLQITEQKNIHINDSFVSIYQINKIYDKQINELNVIFLGNSECGKTTTISHLVYGQMDDGKGSARRFVLRHEHERKSGKTSSIKREIIGFHENEIINYSVGLESSWENIVKNSDRIINLIDTAGDEQYLRTTIYAILTILDHIDGIVVMKDLFSSDYSKTINDLLKIIPCQKILHIITKVDTPKYDTPKYDGTNEISNINGFGFNNLIDFLRNLRKNDIPQYITNEQPLFTVIDVYNIPDMACIYFGLMKNKSLNVGDNVIVTDGETTKEGKILSIKRKQIDSKTIYEGETGSLKLNIDYQFDKNTIIYKNKTTEYNSFVFVNKIKFIPLNMTIKKLTYIKKEYVLFTGNMICKCFLTNMVIDYDKDTRLFKIQSINFNLDKSILPDKTGIIKADNIHYGNIIC